MIELKIFIAAVLFLTLNFHVKAQPGYAGEWKKTRLYGHSYASGDFTDEQYDWIRDHFEYFTIEKTHLRAIYGNPSHERTSRLTATKLIEANPRCKPLMIYSIGGAYPHLFESEAEMIATNPEYWLYNEDDEVKSLNLGHQGENDWYVETVNMNTDSSDLHGIFVDGFKGAYGTYTENVQYMMNRVTGFRLVNGMDFVPNGTSIRRWPEAMEYSDGVFIDAFFRRRVMTPEAGVVLIDACMEIPNEQMFVCFSAYDGYCSTHEFSHAAYLIVAHENTYYRWVDKGDHLWSSTSLMTWHDVFNKEMGEPLSKAVKTGYAYERVFKHCRVNINVKNKTSSIEWDQNNTLVDVKGMSISATNDTISVDDTLQVDANFNPVNATYQGVTWSLSSSTNASINNNGQIIAKKAGKVTVNAISSVGKYKSSCDVVIAPRVQSVSLSDNSISLVRGESIDLEAVVIPEDALNKAVFWSSNNDSVVSVNDVGMITGKSVGTAMVTAKTIDGGFTSECYINVTIPAGDHRILSQNNQDGIIFYPSPANDRLYYDYNESLCVKRLEIYSLRGQAVVLVKVNTKQDYIDIQDYEKGVYIVKIITNDSELFRKIIKR